MGKERQYEISAHLDVDIITSDDSLPADGTDLNFDVDDAQGFRANIDLYETRVDGLVEVAESCDQTDRPCESRLEDGLTIEDCSTYPAGRFGMGLGKGSK